MNKLCAIMCLGFAASTVQGQTTSTIEGFWQDIAGRTTFKRSVSPSSVYGSWHQRELDATYPQAKQILKLGTGFVLTDLNYDEKEYALRILNSDASRIAFIRQSGWSACRMEHDCRLEGSELFCSMQTICREADKDVVDWQGDERYIRREHCARDGGAELQGIPVKCR